MEVDLILPYSLGDLHAGVAGSARVILDLAAGLAAKGHRSRVYAKTSPRLPPAETWRGVDISRLASPKLPAKVSRFAVGQFDLFTVPLLFHGLQDRADAQISFNDPWPCTLPGASFKIFSLHIPNPHLTPRSGLFQRLINADSTVCCSRFVVEKVRSYAPRISREFRCVHNGIDGKPFAEARGEWVREKLGVPRGEVLLMYAGQINELKGLAHLVEALRRVRRTNQDVGLMVIGSSKLWPDYSLAMTNRAAQYELAVRREASNLPVRFAGLVPEAEKPSYFAACDIFVCPSVWNEPFGLTNLEAMSAGKPVVATRVGGIPEVVQHGETGLLVPPGDAAAMADAIGTLAADEDLRGAMGRKGMRVAQTDFSLDRMVDGYLSAVRGA